VTFFFIVAIIYQVNRYLILADYGIHIIRSCAPLWWVRFLQKFCW